MEADVWPLKYINATPTNSLQILEGLGGSWDFNDEKLLSQSVILMKEYYWQTYKNIYRKKINLATLLSWLGVARSNS